MFSIVLKIVPGILLGVGGLYRLKAKSVVDRTFWQELRLIGMMIDVLKRGSFRI